MQIEQYVTPQAFLLYSAAYGLHRVALFQLMKVGQVTLQHRIVLAPLTRFRTYASYVPGPQQASYYSRHSSTPETLLISEATLISHEAGGLGYRKVTDAVHAKGSQDPPSPYVSASPFALTGHEKAPRPLTETEIYDYTPAYAKAASDAAHEAGFDGVEIHSTHGYLLNQFLQQWGGEEEGRTRFAREVIDAVVDAVGEDRVGIYICPWSRFLCDVLADTRGSATWRSSCLKHRHNPNPDENNDFLRQMRGYSSAGGYTRETALRTAEDKGGLIAFGRRCIPTANRCIRGVLGFLACKMLIGLEASGVYRSVTVQGDQAI
ncbi:hypothetical protein EV363DRAFT_1438092 [Boletus edulis]|nr:hypothetical protein EV363DRAFT_1438092 [Boletus edulis]